MHFVTTIVFSDINLHDISGYTVGTQYLNNLEISSAEMTQYLCNIKMSSTNCLTKKYRVRQLRLERQDSDQIHELTI